MNRIIFSFVFVLMATMHMLAQTTIEGKVVDVNTKEPLSFASVGVFRGGVLISGTETDLDGNYFVAEVQPGTYDIEVTYIGYATQRQQNVIIKAGRTNRINFDLTDDAVLLNLGIEIKEYKVPLIEKDNTTQGTVVTAEKIRALPTKNINAIAATSAGISTNRGGDISIRGSRSNETVYFLDGVRVTGNLIPQSEIEQLQVITGGIEARYGDVTGGAISLTSRGPSNKVTGTLELEKSFDGFGYNLISANIAGPILRNSKGQSVLGYRFSGQYRNVKDNSPSIFGVYRAPESLIRTLEANPVYNIGDTQFPSIEEYGSDDIGPTFKARPNDENIDLDLTGRIDLKVSNSIDIQLSANYNDKVNRFTPSTAWSLLNWVNNPYQYSNTYRGNFRFTHRIGSQSRDDESKATGTIRNISYTLLLGYQKDLTRAEDFRHEDRLFDYGYYGVTQRSWQPLFGFRDENDPLFLAEPFGHLGYREEIGEYTLNPNINPILGSYNAINGVNVNGIRNGFTNNAWNNLYSNVGQVYNNFSKTDNDLYTLNLSANFDLFPGGSDKGRHNIQFGVIYEQSVRRLWDVNPFALWQVAELFTNNHITGIDTNNVLGLVTVNSPFGQLQVNQYGTSINPENDNKFFRSVRALVDSTENAYVNIWALSPDQLSLDMFSPNELITQPNIIDYYGFDYLGNKLGTDVRFEDFFTGRDSDGRRTFLVAPYQPIYGAAFIQDKFSYKDIIFRLGMRVDYFDANTKVLRDPYALYEIENAKDYYSRIGEEQPTSIADDYKVYVDSDETDGLVAFRNGDQWYLPNGTAVSGGNVIYQGGLVFPSYAGRTQGRVLDVQSPDFDPNTSFVDYTPQINFMPRLAFSFPISDDAGFFAHYDVLYQRPPSGAFASPLDFYFFNDVTRINPDGAPLNNPNLRPIRTVDYEVGFQQKLSETTALKASAYYKEMKDLIQQRVFANVASPVNQYKMFDNLDFGTVKGFSFTLDRRRTDNLELSATYTLQFADGSGSDANSSNGINNRGPIRNLIPLSFDERHRITAIVDYRYGSGSAYNGPRIGNTKILEDFGINFTSFLVSGQPYTRNSIPQQFGGSGFLGSINGARLPWNFTMDVNIQKRLPVNVTQTKKIWLNAYVRIQNVWNTRNIFDVYKYSNDPENDGFLASSFGLDRIRGIETSGRDVQNFIDAYNWRMLAPGFFSLPRQIFAGVIVDF